MRTIRRLIGTALVLGTFLLPAFGSAAAKGAENEQHDFRIVTVSTRPDTVTGGDVLVRIDVPRNVPVKKVTVTLMGAAMS